MNPLADELVIDHRNPTGNTVEENLCVSCAGCNSEKGTKSAEQFKPSGIVFPPDPRLPLEDILGIVGAKHKLARNVIRSRNQSSQIVAARAEFYFRARAEGYSLPELGNFTGHHHTTVLHLLKKIGRRLSTATTATAIAPLNSNEEVSVVEAGAVEKWKKEEVNEQES
jgi:hypothetical protein